MTTSAPDVVAHGIRVTPRSQTVKIRLPFGGFVWSRPTDVLVARNGQLRHLRIVDVTRALQVLLWSTAVAAWLVGNYIEAHREESKT